MPKRCLLCCFDDNVAATIANMVRAKGIDTHVTAILSAHAMPPPGLPTNVRWIHGDCDNSTLREAFVEIDAMINILGGDLLKKTTELALRFHCPVIYCASHLTPTQERLLEHNSYYYPVFYYEYANSSLEEIMVNVAQLAREADDITLYKGIIRKRGR